MGGWRTPLYPGGQNAIDFAGRDIFNISKLNFADAATLIISSGSITVTQTYHLVDTEAAAATDDLDTINGGSEGDVLFLRAADATRIVVIKHGTGNIVTPDGNDYSLDSTDKVVQLIYDGTVWHLVAGGLRIHGNEAHSPDFLAVDGSNTMQADLVGGTTQPFLRLRRFVSTFRITNTEPPLMPFFTSYLAWNIEQGGSVTFTPTQSWGAAADLFHCDGSAVHWDNPTLPITIEITFYKPTTNIVGGGLIMHNTYYATAIKTEYYDATNNAWVTACDVTGNTRNEFYWTYVKWSVQISKIRITISALADPTAFQLVEVILWRNTQDWKTYFLARDGGTLYGDLDMNSNNIDNLNSINPSGTSLGIGTSTPGALLDVNGTAHLRGSSGATGLYVGTNLGWGTTTPQADFTIAAGKTFAIEMQTPQNVTATTSATGTLNGTYYYKVSAGDGTGWTVLSAEVSATVDGGATAGTITVSWDAVPGASIYRVWRGTSSGGENEYYETTATSIDDDGSLTWTAGTPPSATNAWVGTWNISGLKLTGTVRAINYETDNNGYVNVGRFLQRGVIWNTFDNDASSWTVINGTVTNDTTTKIEGVASLKIDATGTGAPPEAYRSFAGEDWSTKQVFIVFIKNNYNISGIHGNVTIRIGVDSANYVEYKPLIGNQYTDFYAIVLEINGSGIGWKPTTTVGTMDWANVGYLYIRGQYNDSTLWLDYSLLGETGHLVLPTMVLYKLLIGTGGEFSPGTELEIHDSFGGAGAIKVYDSAGTLKHQFGGAAFNVMNGAYIRCYVDDTWATKTFEVDSATGNVYMAGNLGIGTTAPTHLLHVAGDIRIDGTTSTASLAATGTYLKINVGGTDYYVPLYQ